MTQQWWSEMRQAYGVASAYQVGFSQRFEDAAQVFTPQNVMSVGVETDESRAWTVNLNRLRYASGALATVSFAAGTPPDNQVGEALGVPPALPSVTADYIAAEIVWGVAGATERARVDWRQSGTTLQLHASFVRVGIVIPAVLFKATVFSGFIAPSSRSVAQEGVGPTYTYSPKGLTTSLGGTTAQYPFPVPDRAVAYRWFSRAPLAEVNILTFQQADALAGAVSVDMAAPLSIAALGGGQSERMAWVPLIPNAQYVLVTNTSAVNSAQVGLQFLLDMG